jgi:hypothetical protein
LPAAAVSAGVRGSEIILPPPCEVRPTGPWPPPESDCSRAPARGLPPTGPPQSGPG